MLLSSAAAVAFLEAREQWHHGKGMYYGFKKSLHLVMSGSMVNFLSGIFGQIRRLFLAPRESTLQPAAQKQMIA